MMPNAMPLGSHASGESRVDMRSAARRRIRVSCIRSRVTKPKVRVRWRLHRLGGRYRLHRCDLPRVPGLVIPARSNVLVQGCSWRAHRGCKVANKPKRRRSFWRAKFVRNVGRDPRNKVQLRRQGGCIHLARGCEQRGPTRLAKVLGPAAKATTSSNQKHAME